MIKVDSRLRNTFVPSPSPEPQKSGATFYTEGEDTLKNSCVVAASGLAFAHNDRNEYLEQIESEIVQSLNEVHVAGNNESISDATESLVSQDSVPRGILNSGSSEQADSCSPIGKKVEFCEERIHRVAFASPVDGALVSRPVDLPLGESDDVDRPVPPPRIGRYKNSKQRLLSVPNIKYTKQQGDFPLRGKMSVGHKDSISNMMPTAGTTAPSGGNVGPSTSSSFANSFMRRFSKY